MYFFSGTLLAKGHAFPYLSRAEPSLLCPRLHLKGTFLHRDSSVSLLHSAAARNPSFRGPLSAFLTGWCAFGHVVSTQAYRCHTGWGLFFLLYFFLPSSRKRRKKKSEFMSLLRRIVEYLRGRCEANTNSFLWAEDQPQLNILITPLLECVKFKSSSLLKKKTKKEDEEPQWWEVASLYNRLCHFKNVSVWRWMHPACIMHTFFLKVGGVLNESEVMKENICNLIGWEF